MRRFWIVLAVLAGVFFLYLTGIFFGIFLFFPSSKEIPATTETVAKHNIEIIIDVKTKNSPELNDFSDKFEVALNKILKKNPLPPGKDLKALITTQSKLVFVLFCDEELATSVVSWTRIKNLQTPAGRQKFAEKAAQKFFDYLTKDPENGNQEDQDTIEIYREPEEIIT